MQCKTFSAGALLLVVALLSPGPLDGRAAALGSTGAAAVVTEAKWVVSAQLPDGAIAHHVDKSHVWPYLANFAAMGLAEASEVSGDRSFVDAAWRWLDWYQRHQDGHGFVTDYRVGSDGSVVSTGDMDSTDAYAGTYLLAVRKVYRTDPDIVRLRSLKAGIAGAVAAVEATQDADGLTWAKPSWRVKYLMDQAETYAGLRAAADLAATLGDRALQQRAASDAQRMASGVAGLWNPATSSYDWAVHADGSRQTTNWSVFYPDAQQQMWAVAFGLAAGRRANTLVWWFGSFHPDWAEPAATARYDSGPRPVGYWPVTGWAYATVGRVQESQAAASSILAAADSTQRAWPYTPGNSGQLIQLLSSDKPFA